MLEPIPLILVAALVVLFGAIVQSGVGFGVGLIAAPYLVWTLPGTMPATLIIIGGMLALITLVIEWRSVDLRWLGWGLFGRLPGAALGTLLMVVASKQLLGLLIGIIVLIASVLQWRRWQVALNSRNVGIAGIISGTTGTVSGIGGPPMAMVMASETGPRVRGTLAAFFVAGSTMSLITLAPTGNVTGYHFLHALVLLPALGLGAALGRPLARYLDSGRTKAAILILAGASGIVLAVTSVIG